MSSSPLPVNYYEIAPWLVSRIEQLQSVAIDPNSPNVRIRYVAALADVERASEESHAAPAVFVVPLGRANISYTSESSTTCSSVGQRWLIVIAIRDAHLANEVSSLLEDAGYYISAVVNHLNGWRPAPDPLPNPAYRSRYSELRWAEEFEPIFRAEGEDRGGVALFGHVFETRLRVHA